MATARQIDYIITLQIQKGKHDYTRERLKAYSVTDASSIISELKLLPNEVTRIMATPKQVDYIMKLQRKVKERHYTKRQVEEMNNKEVNEAIHFLKFRFQQLL